MGNFLQKVPHTLQKPLEQKLISSVLIFKVLVELFQKLAGYGAAPHVVAFLFVSFFFALTVSKKKRQAVRLKKCRTLT